MVARGPDKLSKGILFLQDNAALHKATITLQKLAYPPDFGPSVYCLFPNLKKHLKG
jgi:hypothetical protein